jgi:hypothetical protein
MKQRRADGGHEQDKGYSRLPARPNGASAFQPTLMPLQALRGEHAMTLKPPLMLIQVLLCPDRSLFRPGDDSFDGGNFRIKERGYV